MCRLLRFFWLLCLMGAVQGVMAQFVIQGEVGGLQKEVVLVKQVAEQEWDTLAQAKIRNGKFRLTGNLTEPAVACLGIKGRGDCLLLLLENASYRFKAEGEQLKLSEVSKEGKLQQSLQQLLGMQKGFRCRYDSLKTEYRKQEAAKDLFGKMHIRAEMFIADSLYDQAESELIAGNDNLFGAWVVYSRLNELVKTKKLISKYELLGQTARNTLPGRMVAGYIQKVKAVMPGGIAPDFVQKTPEGVEMSLYSVKAKVKIVDFWASWCGPCRAENPNVRRMYEKYHDKGLEIISVSLDSKKEAWLKAIEKDQLPWIHLSDLKGWKNAAAQLYGVAAIPYVLVLDEENRVLGAKLRGAELEQCVLKALK